MPTRTLHHQNNTPFATEHRLMSANNVSGDDCQHLKFKSAFKINQPKTINSTVEGRCEHDFQTLTTNRLFLCM